MRFTSAFIGLVLVLLTIPLSGSCTKEGSEPNTWPGGNGGSGGSQDAGGGVGGSGGASGGSGGTSGGAGGSEGGLGGEGGSAGSGGTVDPDAGGMGGAGAGGSGDGGTGNVTDGGSDACSDQVHEVTTAPALLQFVVDTSGSMLWDITNEEPDVGEPTKWDHTRPALIQAIQEAPSSFALGMSFFPNVMGGGGSCIMNEVAVAIDWLTPAQKAATETALTAVAPLGGTPLHDAWAFGTDLLRASTLTGHRYAVIITDGAPAHGKDCTQPPDNALLVADIAAALTTDGISTFLIGSPGSQGGGSQMAPDARPWLSQMAEAGGTAPRDASGALACSHAGPGYCHVDLTTSNDLKQSLLDAIRSMTISVTDCSFDMPTLPAGQTLDPDSVELLYTPNGNDPSTMDAGSIVVPRSGPPCVDGWSFTDPTNTKVTLCGPSCDQIKADQKAKLVVRYDCVGG